MAAVLSRLGIEKGEEGDEALVDESNVVVVRKSFDARMRKVRQHRYRSPSFVCSRIHAKSVCIRS